jgi:hypothetical protein
MRRIVLLLLLTLASTLLGADNAHQFTGRWKLESEQSEIHPGAQWVTEEVDILLVGHLLEFSEKQSFGVDEDVIRRQEKHLMLPNSDLSKGRVRTITNWSRGALVEKSSFPIGEYKQRAFVRLELADYNTLIRTTTVRQLEKGHWVVVLYQREVFGRSFP